MIVSLFKKLLTIIDKFNNFFIRLSLLKKIIFLIVCFVVFVIGYMQWKSYTSGDNFILEKVKIGDITETVSESGNIVATGKTDIYSPSNGMIVDLAINNGDIVKKGQVLFKVKSTATVQEQQAAYANYLTAKASFDSANSSAYLLRSAMYDQWESFRDLATNSTYETDDEKPKTKERESAEFQSAQDDWLAAEKKYKDQQTVVNQAQASVNSTWQLYQATQNATVLATTDGRIANLAISNGDTVQALNANALALTGSTSTNPAMIIVSYTKYIAKISLSETDIYKVKINQDVVLEADALRDVKFKGKIIRYDDIGTDMNGVIKYNVYIEVINPDERLKYGMTIDADITTNTVKNALTVTSSAVKPYQGKKAVRVIDKKTNGYNFIPVITGIKGNGRVQILSGLKEDQEIITSLKNEQVQRKSMFGF